MNGCFREPLTSSKNSHVRAEKTRAVAVARLCYAPADFNGKV